MPKAVSFGRGALEEGEGSAASKGGDAERPTGAKHVRSRAIEEVLDALPLGRFHALLVARMIFFWVAFSSSLEATAYMFSGLRKDFGASQESLSRLASSFSLGSMGGSVLASAVIDSVGRKPAMLVAAPVAALFHLGMAVAGSMRVVTVMRCFQAVAWGFILTAVPCWYSEFLPTHHRGQLLAMYSSGYPLGRALVILVAARTHDAWRPVAMLGTFGFLLMALLLALAPESPRFLLSVGRVADAQRVIGRMHALNGVSWDQETPLRLNAAGVKPQGPPQHVFKRVGLIFGQHAGLLTFSMLVFTILSMTTVLIDTWGPDVFKHLLTPRAKELPHSVLQLFNIGDFCGIILAIILMDYIGRRGSFCIGFLGQGSFFMAMAVAPKQTLALVAGTLASSCRCFAWEAASFWTLEAFPTDLRTTALGLATSAMKVCSLVSLEASGRLMGSVNPHGAVIAFATLLASGGLVVVLTMPLETANRPMAEGSGIAK